MKSRRPLKTTSSQFREERTTALLYFHHHLHRQHHHLHHPHPASEYLLDHCGGSGVEMEQVDSTALDQRSLFFFEFQNLSAPGSVWSMFGFRGHSVGWGEKQPTSRRCLKNTELDVTSKSNAAPLRPRPLQPDWISLCDRCGVLGAAGLPAGAR